MSPADFHEELSQLLQGGENKQIAITGFRGSAKSTFGGVVLPSWAALHGFSRFILLINETSDVADLTIANLKIELEENELLLKDFPNEIGLVKKFRPKWDQHNLVLASGTRLMGIGRGQKVRGLRHRQWRPDLIVIDDPEAMKHIAQKKYRDDTERWLRGEVIPAAEETKARLLVMGNLLHTDSLMPRLKNDKSFIYVEYPLIALGGKTTWLGKYPNEAALRRQEAKVGRTAWLREYLLKVVPPEGQEVKEEWIQFYDGLPSVESIYRSGVGEDLAISKKDTADFTSMVGGVLSRDEKGIPKIYILPNPVNERLSFHETIEQNRALSLVMSGYGLPTFFVEDVGYQKAAIQEMERALIPVEAIHVTTDKRARLRSIAMFIQNGTVVFPRSGCEDLIDQIVNFGITDHDDLMDAFVHLIIGLVKDGLDDAQIIGL